MNKDNLKYLITRIHKASIEYIRALSEKTENIYKIREDLDTYYRDVFYYLKKLRVKYQARENLGQIYRSETEVRDQIWDNKKSEIEDLAAEIRNCQAMLAGIH